MNTEVIPIRDLARIAKRALPNYEIRAVYRFIEDTPCGPKCEYQESPYDEEYLNEIFGGILLACPGRDTTNGAVTLEISSRDNTIRVPRNVTSAHALELKKALNYFGIEYKVTT